MQTPLQLEELIIDTPLLEFPKSIGQLKRLQKIVLSRYIPFQDLAALPEEFYDLCSLKYLILRNCNSFTGFGDLGKLTNLQHICLEGCENFEYLPNSLGNLSNLKYLSLERCKRLNYLPDSLGNLSNLEYLSLTSCESLLNLTDSLGNLSNLQFLSLCCCKELKMLPDSLWNLRNLRYLGMEQCQKLEKLPDSSKMLSTNIREINLVRCESLKMLPDSLGSLTNLRHINLTACQSLEMLPDSFGNLTNLQEIYLAFCTCLEMLPDSLGNLTSLENISLTGCASLEMLPDSFGKLTSLQNIRINKCMNLKMLPDSFGKLTSLQKIQLDDCIMLEKLPTSFWNLPQLEHLHFSSRWNIPSETLGNIISLQWLGGEEYCLQMDRLLPQVARQPCLERMTLLGTNLEESPSDIIAGLSNLEFLILNSPSLEVLPPSFGYQKSLKVLCLYECQKLLCLPESVGLLTQLTHLSICECGIQSLPSAVMKLKNLEKLVIWGCPLRELPFKKEDEGVEGDTALLPESSRAKREELNELDSSFAEKGMMVKLQELCLFDTEIREISFPEGVCPNLRDLNIIACNALRKIGGLDGLVELHTLRIKGCPIEVDELLLPAQKLKTKDICKKEKLFLNEQFLLGGTPSRCDWWERW